MGSAQSYIPVATLVVAGAAAYGYSPLKKPAPVLQGQGPSTASSSASSSSKKQKQKKKAGMGASASAGAGASSKEDVPAEPSVVSFPPVVPGGFDAPSDSADRPAAASKPKKKKKAKKASPVPVDAQSESSATAPESSAARKPKKSATPKPPALDDDGWTRVETKRKVARDATKADAPAGEGRPQLEVSTSDAGITTSVTGNSSPVTERTEDESALADSGISENRRTLAERLLPKPRKTGVEECVSFIPDVWATLTQSW